MSKFKHIITVTMNPAIDLACQVPDFTAGKVNRVAGYQTDAAGKGVNIAVLLRKFDLPVTVTGFLGADNALIFEKLFSSKGLKDEFVRVPGETRIGVKVLDPDSGATTDINFPGLSPDAGHVDKLMQTVDNLADESSIVVIGGSLPATVSPAAVGQLVNVIKSCGAKAVVDTSGPALSSAIVAVPCLVKPNDAELSELVGRPLKKKEELVNEARRMNRSGIDTVVVSLGSQGALFISQEEEFFAKPPTINAVSTVGAGDAMIGGMVAGMALELSLRERACLATSLSAATVAQAGPSLEDIEIAKELEEQVVIETISF
ncbi:1-phosphofructokinase [Maridesulfovibrio zosterae]|uniref:1-phosphofructokinase n=1 Tax=Maridesulfovibrio zosterae TaxID=82171 RepID=UPI0004840106|nr:1-phosphofructokinase [Maridesulfovibrio zosterae]